MNLSIWTERPDPELIAAVRSGEISAYGALFDRHREAAMRVARYAARNSTDADDLVAEAFAKVLAQLQAGRGPDTAFRAYLLTTVRRLHIDRTRAQQREVVTDSERELDRGVEFDDLALAEFERGTAGRAFASLPERWQLVLWHLDVERQKPAEVAPLLGLSPNSVSALAYRAREGLRQAYLRFHLTDVTEESCQHTTELLGAYVRGGLSNRDATKVRTHLDECARCMGVYLELNEINADLRAVIGPIVLGGALAAYLAGSGSAATLGGGLMAGVKNAFASATQGAKTFVSKPTSVFSGSGAVAQTAIVVGVVAAVAAVAVTGVVMSGGGTPESSAIAAPVMEEPSPASTKPISESDDPPGEPSAEPDDSDEPEAPIDEEPVAVDPPPVAPAAQPDTEPSPKPEPEPETTPEPEPEPELEPVELSIAGVAWSGHALERLLTVDFGAQGTYEQIIIAVTVRFNQTVWFEGSQTSEWRCDPANGLLVNRPVVCTANVTDAVPQLRLAVLWPGSMRGTVSVSTADDEPHDTEPFGSSGAQPAGTL